MLSALHTAWRHAYKQARPWGPWKKGVMVERTFLQTLHNDDTVHFWNGQVACGAEPVEFGDLLISRLLTTNLIQVTCPECFERLTGGAS